MKFSNIVIMNIKPFVFYTILVVLGTGGIGISWNSSYINTAVLIVFLLMLIFHYFAGFLLNNYHTWYLNLLSVLFIFIFNFILYLYEKFHGNELQSLIDMTSMIFKLPFLYILGWQGMNYPLLVVFLPAILLWIGLMSKLIIQNKLKCLSSRIS